MIIAIDPGPEHSAYCGFNEGEIISTAWVPNGELIQLLRFGELPDVVAVESPQAQDRPFGKLFRDTVIMAGRIFEAIQRRGVKLVEVDERDARTWLVGKATASNTELHQALKNHFGETKQIPCACGDGRVPGKKPGTTKLCAACSGKRIRTQPGPLARLNEHERSAVAVALYWWQKTKN